MSKDNGKPKTIRCVVYTRKSTDENLDLDFNSLDAQREAGEAYIKSQQHEGWVRGRSHTTLTLPGSTARNNGMCLM